MVFYLKNKNHCGLGWDTLLSQLLFINYICNIWFSGLFILFLSWELAFSFLLQIILNKYLDNSSDLENSKLLKLKPDEKLIIRLDFY